MMLYLLLAFVHVHNATYSCEEANKVDRAAQKQGQRCTASDCVYSSSDPSDHECDLLIQKQKRKRVRSPAPEVAALELENGLESSDEDLATVRSLLTRRISLD